MTTADTSADRIEALEAALRVAKIANVDLAINAAKMRANAVNILRVTAQRAQSTDGNEEDVGAIYREINEAIDALSGKEET